MNWLRPCRGRCACKLPSTMPTKTRRVTVSLGWLPLRLPATQQRLWALVAYNPDYRRQIILLTNVPLTSPEVAEQVYTQWRCRSGAKPLAVKG